MIEMLTILQRIINNVMEEHHFGAAIALRLTCFWASSNRRTITSHLVVLQICFEDDLISSENNVKPAARSTASTNVHPESNLISYIVWPDVLPGTEKLSKGVVSGIAALGRTKAPVDISGTSGLEGDDGLEVKTTLAKWVGTLMFGGFPITSWV